jgi:hypothetical protein
MKFLKKIQSLICKIVLASIVLLFVSSCNIDESRNNEKIDESLLMFPYKTLSDVESETVEHLSTTLGTNVKMIGFKTIYIDKDSRIDFFNFYRENQESFDQIKNHYYSYLRIYFPVNLAYAEYDNNIYAASESGDIKIENTKSLKNVKVIGRKKTDLVRGVASNIIKGDTIFLRKEVKVDHIINENVLVFDFGERKLSNNLSHHNGCVRLKTNTEHSDDSDDSTKACTENHDGYNNCSDAFNINMGRCLHNSSVCMDYNGIFTDCVNYAGMFNFKRYRNFVGSDCDYAMGRGHCFNED